MSAAQLPPVTTLSPTQKRELLAKLLKERASKQKEIHPLSHNQRAMWFLQQFDETSSAYNSVFSVSISSSVNVDALQQAFQKLLLRHPILRTTYISREGEPFQLIHGYRECDFAVIPSTSLTDEKLIENAKHEIRRPFDLEKDNVMRVRLYSRSATDHLLLIVIHHIATDGWSTWVLLDDLRRLYAAECTGESARLPALTHRYVDYVKWQEALLESESGQQMGTFWKTALAEEPPILNMPTDFPRPAIQSNVGASHQFEISPQVTASLRQLQESAQTTLYAIILASFQTLLHLYTGQNDIWIGSPVSGRSQAEFLSLVGDFINTVVMTSEVDPTQSFKNHLHQVKSTINRGLEHQNYPFSLLVEEISPQRDLSRAPLVQAALVVQKPPAGLRDIVRIFSGESGADPVDFGGLQIMGTPLNWAQQEGQFDLNLEVFDFGDRIGGNLRYSTDLFTAETAQQLTNHLSQLLSQVAANPDLLLSDISLLSDLEIAKLINEWNNQFATVEPGGLVLDRITAQAAQTPQKRAVSDQTGVITYEELNVQANQFARVLRDKGVQPGDHVGVYLSRAKEMVVAMLAIWKAGAAYLPLDPSFPDDRLAYMCADAAAQTIISTSPLAEQSNWLPGNTQILCLDQLGPLISAEPSSDIGLQPNGQSVAYIIHTSGSTGRPKGVQVEHRQLANFLNSMQKRPGLTAADKLLAITTLSFDISILELFLPLVSGAELHVASKEIAADGFLLRQTLEQEDITVMQATPSTWSMLLNAGWDGTGSLQKALCGGEALSRDLAQQLLRRSVDLWNMYGPTETTIWSCIRHVTEVGAQSIPIGEPIDNTSVYILDNYMRPVPKGVVGNLYIGGHGVARGYLNRPELTAERFIPNPFKNDDRIYKTGDLARFRRDGQLEFWGRADFQVKVRGFRIELGEIEHALRQHTHVKEAVVTTDARQSQSTRIHAYLISDNGEEIPADQMRHFLADRLPSYMVPNAYIWLEKFPLTPNQKINRRALPDVDISQALINDDDRPRSEIEGLVADIWSAVLKVSPISIHSNFFDLGGHSLLATQVVSRIQSQLGVQLPLRSLFETPTISGVAQQVVAALRNEDTTNLPEITRVDRNSLLPLSFAQERMWFLNQLLADDSAYHISSVLRFDGPPEFESVGRAVNAMIERHEDLRTVFPVVEGTPYQKILPPFDYELPIVDLRDAAETEEERLAKAIELIDIDFKRKFDLAAAPPLRLQIFRINDETQLSYFVFHHIIFDQWSSGILWDDYNALVQYFSGLKPTLDLPEIDLHYVDFAVWQRNWLQGENLERELSFWRKKLAGLSVLELPTDRPRPPAQTYVGSLKNLKLSSDLLERLNALARQENVTLFILMLSIFKLMLSRYARRTDIAVGVPVANRHRLAVEHMLGTFVNLLVMRTELQPNQPFTELLAAVRNTALDTYAHQEMPFEKLVEELVVKRDPAHTPLIQVLFNMVNAPFEVHRIEGTDVNAIDFDRKAAQFDLNFSISAEIEQLSVPQIGVEYNTDLFDSETIERMLGHYKSLLEQIVADPHRPINEYEMLTAPERVELLDAWNDTAVELPLYRCVHHLIEDQVAQSPQRIAAVADGQSITYAALNARANQLAHHLRQQGVGPGDLIGLSIKRSIDMLVGLLGIWKAGCAYLPMDPTYPEERLAYILADAAAPVVVSQQALAHKWSGYDGTIINIDTDWDTIAQQDDSNPVVNDLTSEHLAYIIHTSGSTGKPKGVQIHHYNAVNFLLSMAEKPGLTAADTLLAVTTISFDIAVLELYLPLLVGARVVIATKANSVDGQWLIQTMKDEAVTALQATPATWKLLLSVGWEGTPGLKMMCGGEEMPRSLAEELIPRGGTLWNMYGPTETTVWSAVKQIHSDSGPVPIGEPIANTQIYILDETLTPTPVGVPGELCIGGDGVALGYLNRPELTAERFIDDPFRPGQKLYKVGDLARYRPDGTIEFLGRIDFQVKVRGYRIELGEIETVLQQHSAVKEGVVVARDDANGIKRLVAYLIPEGTEEPAASELREHIGSQLPNYMVPTLFVPLETWPLTPNGKIDRKNLPEPDTSSLTPGEQLVPPRTETEVALARLWCETLNLKEIGVTDNFFELGGHSLIAVQMFSKIDQIFEVDIPLGTLFEAPTIAELATIIEAEHPSDKALGESASGVTPSQNGQALQQITQVRHTSATNHLQFVVQINQGSADKYPFFCVHGAGGNVLYFKDLAEALPAELPFYGLQAKGVDGSWDLHTSIEEMAESYLAEMQVIQPHGPYHLGGYSGGGTIALEIAHRLQSLGEEVAVLTFFDTIQPEFTRVSTMSFSEHLQKAREEGFGYLFGRVRNRLRTVTVRSKQMRELNELQAARQRVPIELRDMMMSNHLGYLLTRYVVKPYKGQVILFSASDPWAPHAHVGPDRGWNESIQNLDVVETSGNHNTHVLAPHIQSAADYLARKLETTIKRF